MTSPIVRLKGSAWYKGKEAWPSTLSASQLYQRLQSKLRGSRFNQRARTTRDGRVCVIKRRYNNIGVILIFILSFNIEDTSTSSFIQTYYIPHGWQLRNFLCGNFQLKDTSSCLISTKKQRFEENVSFNKKYCLPRDQGQSGPHMSLKALFRRISNRKSHSFFNNQLFNNIIFLMKRIRKYKCNDRGDLCMH